MTLKGRPGRRIEKFRKLRDTNPGSAERFLPRHFQLKTDFTIALVQPDSGLPFDGNEMVDSIAANLMHRANNNFTSDVNLPTTWLPGRR